MRSPLFAAQMRHPCPAIRGLAVCASRHPHGARKWRFRQGHGASGRQGHGARVAG